jgi:hypothetical protein
MTVVCGDAKFLLKSYHIIPHDGDATVDFELHPIPVTDDGQDHRDDIRPA